MQTSLNSGMLVPPSITRWYTKEKYKDPIRTRTLGAADKGLNL